MSEDNLWGATYIQLPDRVPTWGEKVAAALGAVGKGVEGSINAYSKMKQQQFENDMAAKKLGLDYMKNNNERMYHDANIAQENRLRATQEQYQTYLLNKMKSDDDRARDKMQMDNEWKHDKLNYDQTMAGAKQIDSNMHELENQWKPAGLFGPMQPYLGEIQRARMDPRSRFEGQVYPASGVGPPQLTGDFIKNLRENASPEMAAFEEQQIYKKQHSGQDHAERDFAQAKFAKAQENVRRLAGRGSQKLEDSLMRGIMPNIDQSFDEATRDELIRSLWDMKGWADNYRARGGLNNLYILGGPTVSGFTGGSKRVTAPVPDSLQPPAQPSGPPKRIAQPQQKPFVPNATTSASSKAMEFKQRAKELDGDPNRLAILKQEFPEFY